jgi:hypothetical protein
MAAAEASDWLAFRRGGRGSGDGRQGIPRRAARAKGWRSRDDREQNTLDHVLEVLHLSITLALIFNNRIWAGVCAWLLQDDHVGDLSGLPCPGQFAGQSDSTEQFCRGTVYNWVPHNGQVEQSGRSAAVAHLVWDQGVVGSNPAAPTIFRIQCAGMAMWLDARRFTAPVTPAQP